ncbi:unnamed protein product [Urochloa humidicola]
MSMLSSCTLLSMAPPALAPAKFSPATLKLRTKQPAASSLAVALPRAAPRYKLSRALRLVCHATQPLEYDILPSALVHPSIGDHRSWKIYDDMDHITLMFNVGKGTEEKNLEVKTVEDPALALWLHIRYKGEVKDNSLATKLDIRLQMPPGYGDKNVMTTELLPDGFLLIIITKPKKDNFTKQVTKPKENPIHGATTGETPPDQESPNQ